MTSFYSIFVEQGCSEVSGDNPAKMMMSSCSKFDVWQKSAEITRLEDKSLDKAFDIERLSDKTFDDDEEEEFSEEFGPDGFPKGKRLAPVGANEEVFF